jgi:hypothetical protein
MNPFQEAAMRTAIRVFAVWMLIIGLGAARAGSQSTATSGFDRLKTLVGTWDAVTPEGAPMTSTIRLVSNGTAIEETFQSTEAHQMVTLYSRDGDKVAMIHLCEIGNQPRMETPSLSAGASDFDFSFTGATNLASPEDPHMQHMFLEIADYDHFNETWTLHANGKDLGHATFHFTRRKS